MAQHFQDTGTPHAVFAAYLRKRGIVLNEKQASYARGVLNGLRKKKSLTGFLKDVFTAFDEHMKDNDPFLGIAKR